MTRLLLTPLLTALTVLVTQTSFAATPPAPVLKSEPTTEAVLFSKIYAPVGFDSNDHVQFVGEGMFSNTCYRPATVTVAVDNAKKIIKVGPVAYKYNGLCLQVILPFDRTVDVGVLSAGTWAVVQLDNKQIGQIKVAPALTADPDDYLYAPISQAYVHETNGKEELMLNGSFPNSCMTMQDVKFNVSDDVIVVQPIAQMAAGPCTGPAVPFTQVVQLGAIKAGRYLLHVRSMNAQAINTMIDLQ
jgi:hypothetical protein